MTVDKRFIKIHKKFLSPNLAGKLRKAFDSVYTDPRHTHPKRFMWDHWHLENQYRMHRTMARDFFPENIYQELQNKLVKFGQDDLGCHSISEPWLSYYTEGDEQALHTDSPHGPWAFVYSLTDWQTRKFKGGETLILQPEILNYWKSFSRDRGKEGADLLKPINAEFNQLLVFDPRLPHGVRRVSGVHDPRHARLVVHGWFVNPEPYITGSLRIESITEYLNHEIGTILSQVEIPSHIHGILTFRLKVSSSGHAHSVAVLTSTLVNDTGVPPNLFIQQLSKQFKKINFPKAKGPSQLTLPLIFD